MKRTILILSLCLPLLSCAARGPAIDESIMTFQWPYGAKAVVCMTYDDGIDQHLDNAVPDLDAVNMLGTFYVPGHSESLNNRMDEWRAMEKHGHEIGNHTLFHPCLHDPPGGEPMEWVLPEWALENYTINEIVTEISVANTLLKAVDGKEHRTLAYTCCHTTAGGESFIDGIRPMFSAARGGDSRIPSDMRDVDLYLVPSWGVDEPTAEEMIDFVNRAAQAGTMAVFMFHGVGGPYLNVSREAHRELLAYLDDHRDIFWVDTFKAVTDHIISERQRLGWD